MVLTLSVASIETNNFDLMIINIELIAFAFCRTDGGRPEAESRARANWKRLHSVWLHELLPVRASTRFVAALVLEGARPIIPALYHMHVSRCRLYM